jgi:hypothetical protein
MRMTLHRIPRLAVAAAVLALPLAACAAVGGGGTHLSDCDSDVSGSELTPLATGSYVSSSGSCSNNAFGPTDLDAFAYPPSDGDDLVTVVCAIEPGGSASWRLFEVTAGIPIQVDSGVCDNGSLNPSPNSPGTRYVLVISHDTSPSFAEFGVFTEDL